jgi:hypothetical protein
MSVGKKSTIGFDRTIHLEWLDIAAAHVLRGEKTGNIRNFLWDFLEGIVPGKTHSSGRGKTITVLTRAWLTVPSHVEPLRAMALECLESANGQNRIGIHWAMVIATHPFFSDVATQVGRLLALHGQANRSQIKRRMTESWGDRSTLERAIQQVLKSMAQWGVLQRGSEKGSLVAARNRIHIPDEIAVLLGYAILLSQGHGMPLALLQTNPLIFPFELKLNSEMLRQHPALRIQRQGDRSEFVELAP